MASWELLVCFACLNLGIRVQGLGFRGAWSSGVEISVGLCISL